MPFIKNLDLIQDNSDKTEASISHEKQTSYTLLGSLKPNKGHTLWEINLDNHEIKKAEFIQIIVPILDLNKDPTTRNRKEILTNKGYIYISALNKNNALKKFISQLKTNKHHGTTN